MCVEFNNLNIAFPKYPYPIPNIDHLINKSFGYKTLSFMVTYYGYNKINHVNMPKTKFMSNHDIYYYNVVHDMTRLRPINKSSHTKTLGYARLIFKLMQKWKSAHTKTLAYARLIFRLSSKAYLSHMPHA